MSLVKQLWLAISGLMLLVFISSFLISSISAKAYYQEQLSLKNNDNANSLALVLTQMEKDPVTVELLVSAQFDTGNYKKIELLDPNRNVRVLKTHSAEDLQTNYPEWFSKLVSLKIQKGVAQVQDGWKQYGVLFIESDDRFAYQALWKTTWQFFVWFLAATLILGALGTWVIRLLTRPLDDVVEQAEAMESRRFLTSRIPGTLEFRKVVQAMNSLTNRVKEMLEKESKRLEALRFKTQHDELTGLANRQHYMNQFDALLADKEQEGSHLILIVRFAELARINQVLAHQQTDMLLKEFANLLQTITDEFSASFASAQVARLNGSDFSILISGCDAHEDFILTLQGRLETFANSYEDVSPIHLPSAAIQFSANHSRVTVLQQLDALLAQAELTRSYEVSYRKMSDLKASMKMPGNAKQWRTLLESVVGKEDVLAEYYPVKSVDGQLLHEEAMMRVEIDGEKHSAGYFLPWAKRLGLLPELDLQLIRSVIHKLQGGLKEGQQKAIAVNLSIESLEDYECREKILLALQEVPECCQWIWIEIPEKSALEEIGQFIEFSQKVKALGCKIGLDRAGSGFSSIPKLQEIGLDYIKLDSSLTQDLLEQDTQTNGFVRSVCGLGHSIGLIVVAEGVKDLQVAGELEYIGFDGMTGPAVK